MTMNEAQEIYRRQAKELEADTHSPTHSFYWAKQGIRLRNWRGVACTLVGLLTYTLDGIACFVCILFAAPVLVFSWVMSGVAIIYNRLVGELLIDPLTDLALRLREHMRAQLPRRCGFCLNECDATHKC